MQFLKTDLMWKQSMLMLLYQWTLQPLSSMQLVETELLWKQSMLMLLYQWKLEPM